MNELCANPNTCTRSKRERVESWRAQLAQVTSTVRSHTRPGDFLSFVRGDAAQQQTTRDVCQTNGSFQRGNPTPRPIDQRTHNEATHATSTVLQTRQVLSTWRSVYCGLVLLVSSLPERSWALCWCQSSRRWPCGLGASGIVCSFRLSRVPWKLLGTFYPL